MSEPTCGEWTGINLDGPWRLINDHKITGNHIPTIIDSNDVPLFSAHAYPGVLERIVADHQASVNPAPPQQ